MDEPLLFAHAKGLHPKYGTCLIDGFTPAPDAVFGRIAYLQEHGDPDGELPLLNEMLATMARCICRDTAILCATVCERAEMEDTIRRFVDLSLPPALPSEEAFGLWLEMARHEAEMELQSLRSAGLAPDVTERLAELIQKRLWLCEQKAADEQELVLQLVAVWWMHEELLHVAGIPLDAVGMLTGEQWAKELAQRILPLSVDYALSLGDVPSLPLERFATLFRRALAKHQRIRENPSGTGKNPEYEHEVAESQLDLPEDDEGGRLALEDLVQGSEPDPCEVVADADAAERLLGRFGKRTAELLRLMMQGRTTAEAARELGMNESTARKLLERARKNFSRTP